MNIRHFFYIILDIVSIAVTLSLASHLNHDVRLIGASDAEEGEFPWIVSLKKDKSSNGTYKHFCAGSIADETHIVTAAHCVWDKEDMPIAALAGSLNKDIFDEGAQFINVSKIIVHPDYTRAGPYDIAVLELAQPLVFNDRVNRIALPLNGSEVIPGSICTHAGWGNRFLITLLYYSGSDVLRKVESYALPKFACKLAYLIFRKQAETAFCTAAGPLKGACQGDSGGPVTCLNSNKKPFLAGVVSWGWIICGDGFHPDVSTDVSAVSDFLIKALKSNETVETRMSKTDESIIISSNYNFGISHSPSQVR